MRCGATAPMNSVQVLVHRSHQHGDVLIAEEGAGGYGELHRRRIGTNITGRTPMTNATAGAIWSQCTGMPGRSSAPVHRISTRQSTPDTIDKSDGAPVAARLVAPCNSIHSYVIVRELAVPARTKRGSLQILTAPTWLDRCHICACNRALHSHRARVIA